MNKKPEDSHSRHAALARLLAEALHAHPASGGPAEDSACPDAEIIAAYAEHGLAAEEIARWESHFADCDRCQKIIATLAVSDEELTPAEVAKLGTLAGVAPTVPIRRRPTPWRWLVPAMGLAAGVALWFALHPAAPTPVLTSQKTTTEAPQQGIAPSPPAASANPGYTQSAQANVPPSPAAAPTPSPAPLRDEKQTAPNVPAAPPEPAPKQEVSSSAEQTVDNRIVNETPANSRVFEANRADRNASVQAAPAQQPESSDAAIAAAAPAPAPSGVRAAPRAAAGAVGGGNFGGIGIGQGSGLGSATMPPVFGSSDRTSLWRLRVAGRIERSTDGGQTWQLQASGLTSDLLAGAAPSETVAWVAGRAGAIARTTDGQTWQRVTPPPGPAQDWIAVEARDALHATITSRDLRRFATEDGGRTWAPQP